MSQTKTSKANKRKSRRQSGSLPLLLTLGGFALVAIALFALQLAGRPAQGKAPLTASGRPQISVDKEKVDLGDMKFNALAKVDFQVSNTGDQALEIKEKPYVEVLEGC